MERTVTERLMEWWERGSTACLCLVGAPRVGKTHTAREFLSRVCPGYVYADVNDRETLHKIRYINVRNGMERTLKNLDPDWRDEGGVLLLDGGLDYPEFLAAAAYYSSRDGFRTVLTGDRLPNMNELMISSHGKKKNIEIVRMYPMTFSEFLTAAGIGAGAQESAKRCLERRETPDGALGDELERRYREYLLVGGLPEAVEAFLSTGDVASAIWAQDRAAVSLRRRTAHEDDWEGTALRILETLPDILDTPHKLFSYVPRPGETPDRERVRRALDLLERSGEALAVHVSRQTDSERMWRRTPGLLTTQKLFPYDVGLLSSEYAAHEYAARAGFRSAVLSGAPAAGGAPQENFLAQEFAARSVCLMAAGCQLSEGPFAVRGPDGTDIYYVRAGKSEKEGRPRDRRLSLSGGVRNVYELGDRKDVTADGRRIFCPAYMAGFADFGYGYSSPAPACGAEVK